MIRRHPHVFGSAHASSANEVLDIWDKVKTGERNAANESLLNNAANEGLLDKEAKPEGLLDSVPVSFPALMQASKISRKAVSAGLNGILLMMCGQKSRKRLPNSNSLRRRGSRFKRT